MKKIARFRRVSLCLLALLLSLIPGLALSGCGKVADNTVFSVDDLSGKNVGVQLGTTGDLYVSDYEEDGSGTTVTRFNKGSDAIAALKQGKVDAVVIDFSPAKEYVNLNPELMILDDDFALEKYAMCVSKSNKELTEKLNSALDHLSKNGTLDDIIDYYINPDSSAKPYTSPEGINRKGTLVMATNAYFKPYEFYDGGKIVGIDAEIAQAICDYLEMNLKIEDMEFNSIITAVSSGKADFGAAGMTVTEERLKNIDFTNSYTTARQVVVVRDNEAIKAQSNIIEKAKNDFIKDARYKYILTGLLSTLLITLVAAVIGIALGFLVAIICAYHDQTGNFKITNLICRLYLTIIRGTPAMVQLLIIYYIIFGSVNISKIVVAFLAFGINSGAYVAEIVRSGIMSIDKGQLEAARSLGLSYSQAFITVIMPQAFKNVLPALANEFIVLLKETSISGYIGLNDLTRGGDIIRSITYDAFLPLFAVAGIYLILVVILTKLVNKLERRLRSNER